jgi:hypothetical protein
VEKSSDARSILKEAASLAIKRKNLRSPQKKNPNGSCCTFAL